MCLPYMASSTETSAIWCLIIAIDEDVDKVCPNENKTQSCSLFSLCTQYSTLVGNKVMQKTRQQRNMTENEMSFLPSVLSQLVPSAFTIW